MGDKKALATGAVLTITTGIVMVERFESVHEAFEWIMGHPVWTHEMPRFGDEARDRVVAQYPEIATAADRDNFRTILADAVQRHGARMEVEQGDAIRNVDPITSRVQAREEARHD